MQQVYADKGVKNSEVQTHPSGLLIFACNLLISELDEFKTDEELMRPMRRLVRHLLSKAKQNAGVIHNMISVQHGSSPEKIAAFIDMQREGKSAEKSWHFDIRSPCKHRNQESQQTQNMDIYDKIDDKLNDVRSRHTSK